MTKCTAKYQMANAVICYCSSSSTISLHQTVTDRQTVTLDRISNTITTTNMSHFGSKVFRTTAQQLQYEKTLAGRYQKGMKKHPFLLFGFPFLLLMGVGSVALSNFTAVRYEKRDRRVQELDDEENLKIVKNKRKVDVKEEYYRLQHMGEEDWEPKRVPRMKGESENVF